MFITADWGDVWCFSNRNSHNLWDGTTLGCWFCLVSAWWKMGYAWMVRRCSCSWQVLSSSCCSDSLRLYTLHFLSTWSKQTGSTIDLQNWFSFMLFQVEAYWCRFSGPHPPENLRWLKDGNGKGDLQRVPVEHKLQNGLSTSPVVVRSEKNVTDFFKWPLLFLSPYVYTNKFEGSEQKLINDSYYNNWRITNSNSIT